MKMLSHNSRDFFDDIDKIKNATDYFRKLFTKERHWIENLDLQHLYTT
jgi:hypothetical protein